MLSIQYLLMVHILLTVHVNAMKKFQTLNLQRQLAMPACIRTDVYLLRKVKMKNLQGGSTHPDV